MSLDTALQDRALARQALVALASTDLTAPAKHTHESVRAEFAEHLDRTIATSAVLRNIASRRDLYSAADHLLMDGGEWFPAVRWAPALADQLAFVLLRLLAYYERQAQALAEREVDARRPRPSDQAFAVTRDDPPGM